MKIKTLKIKVENESQEFAIPSFYALTNIIYSTRAELIREDGEYYWIIMIAFEPKVDIFPGISRVTNKQLPIGFKEAAKKYINMESTKKIRVKNCVNLYLEELIEVKNMNDFKQIRGLGGKTIINEFKFLSGLLEIIKRHQSIDING